ncbi:hypothetical protein Tco_0337715 [Tanacetum coccineum]
MFLLSSSCGFELCVLYCEPRETALRQISQCSHFRGDCDAAEVLKSVGPGKTLATVLELSWCCVRRSRRHRAVRLERVTMLIESYESYSL